MLWYSRPRKRIDGRPKNDPAGQYGIKSPHRGMDGKIIGGYMPTPYGDRAFGTKDGGGGGSITPRLDAGPQTPRLDARAAPARPAGVQNPALLRPGGGVAPSEVKEGFLAAAGISAVEPGAGAIARGMMDAGAEKRRPKFNPALSVPSYPGLGATNPAVTAGVGAKPVGAPANPVSNPGWGNYPKVKRRTMEYRYDRDGPKRSGWSTAGKRGVLSNPWG